MFSESSAGSGFCLTIRGGVIFTGAEGMTAGNRLPISSSPPTPAAAAVTAVPAAAATNLRRFMVVVIASSAARRCPQAAGTRPQPEQTRGPATAAP